jgi:hypothetical protein
VRRWTDDTRRTSEEIIGQATKTLLPDAGTNQRHAFVVFNTLGVSRTNVVSVALPADWAGDSFVCDDAGRQLASQMINREGPREFSSMPLHRHWVTALFG